MLKYLYIVMKNEKIKAKNTISYDTLAFESVKSRQLTRFVNYKKYEKSVGLTDIIPLFIGYENCLPAHSFGPFARSSYLIHYVTSGKGVYERGGKKYTVKKGEAFIIYPDEATTYTADKENPWSYIWVAFEGSLASELLVLERPVVKINGEPFYEVKNLVDTADYISAEKVASVIMQVFNDIFAVKNTRSNVITQIENYVKTQYMTDISVDGIALAVRLDRRYLSRLFKNEKGVSLQDFIITVRLERAKELLLRGVKVKDVASNCGYQSQFNFTKAFKKRFNVSPSKYIKTKKSTTN